MQCRNIKITGSCKLLVGTTAGTGHITGGVNRVKPHSTSNLQANRATFINTGRQGNNNSVMDTTPD